MKKTLAISLITASMFLGQAAAAKQVLEPCINGGVSSSGMYNSQSAETVALEPCINGGVLPGQN